jgi:hypothetical protein
VNPGADAKPSLLGPFANVDRAESHLRAFDTAWQRVIDSNTFTFVHEVNADGVSHRYRAVDVPELDDHWALVLADCAHNLRAALDHLAHELVRAHGGEPDDDTRFPVITSPGLVAVAGGVGVDALQVVEEVQPYAHTGEGNRILAIDVIDRVAQGRRLDLVPAATGHIVPVPRGRENLAPQIRDVWTSDRALEPGKTMFGYTYGEPYFGSDLSVKVMPHLVLAEPAVVEHFGRIDVSMLFGDKLIPWLREQYLPRFEPFF